MSKLLVLFSFFVSVFFINFESNAEESSEIQGQINYGKIERVENSDENKDVQNVAEESLENPLSRDKPKRIKSSITPITPGQKKKIQDAIKYNSFEAAITRTEKACKESLRKIDAGVKNISVPSWCLKHHSKVGILENTTPTEVKANDGVKDSPSRK